MKPTILVDADACPVKHIIEQIAIELKIEVIMFVDTSHILESDYSKIITIGQDRDAVDLALINTSHRGDIVITQDYGLASLVLGKGAYAINQNGRHYTLDNIDRLLFERHLSQRSRRMKKKGGHIPKRTLDDDLHFETSFRQLCLQTLSNNEGK